MTDVPPAAPGPGDDGKDSTIRCRSCSAEISKLAQLCPNCGAPVEISESWPPSINQGQQKPKVDSGSVGEGVGHGCVLFIGGAILWGMLINMVRPPKIPPMAIALAMLMPVVGLHLLCYNYTSNTSRLTARAMGFTLIVCWALLLGLALACNGMLV